MSTARRTSGRAGSEAAGGGNAVSDSEAKGLLELVGDLRALERARAGLRDDDHVPQREPRSRGPEEFADPPLHAIAHHGVADRATDGDAEPRLARSWSIDRDHDE